jgi:hypothetical protein
MYYINREVIKMKEIKLSKHGTVNRGKYKALVDDDVFDEVNQYSWTYWNKKTSEIEYAINQSIKKFKNVYLHNYVWNLKIGDIPSGKLVEHIDRNGLNCQIENLRLATPSENNCNHKIQSNNTSGYVGISKGSAKKECKDGIHEYPCWHAYIKYEHKYYTKDFYYHDDNEEQKFQEAVQWRKNIEQKLHKEFVPKDR